jgi:hypothetical protein
MMLRSSEANSSASTDASVRACPDLVEPRSALFLAIIALNAPSDRIQRADLLRGIRSSVEQRDAPVKAVLSGNTDEPGSDAMASVAKGDIEVMRTGVLAGGHLQQSRADGLPLQSHQLAFQIDHRQQRRLPPLLQPEDQSHPMPLASPNSIETGVAEVDQQTFFSPAARRCGAGRSHGAVLQRYGHRRCCSDRRNRAYGA